MRVNGRPVVLALAVVLLCAISQPGCGPKHLVTAATMSDVTMDGALTAQKIITDTYTAGGMAEDRYKAWQAAFLKMGEADKLMNQAIRESNEAGVLKQVDAMLGALQGLIDLEIPKLPESQRAVVLIALQSTRTTLKVIQASWETPK